jgi:hypothetical protein
MNKLSTAKRAAVVAALVEGNSIRSTARMTDVSKPTILKLLADLGTACAEYHDKTVRNLKPQRVQCDEIWSFVGAKQKNVPEEKKAEWGDLWTWTAIDADTKLIVSYLVAPRSPRMAWELIIDLGRRVVAGERFQLSTDGLPWYVHAIDHVFGIDVDYGIIQKHFARGGDQATTATRYSPPKMVSINKEVIKGSPNMDHISTSYVERQN